MLVYWLKMKYDFLSFLMRIRDNVDDDDDGDDCSSLKLFSLL